MPTAVSAPFTQQLHEYQPLIRRVCRLYCQDADDRQDLFQEIVLQLWRAWPRYVPRPDVKLSTWLYRIALNVAISNLRQRTRRPTRVGLDDDAARYLAQPTEASANVCLCVCVSPCHVLGVCVSYVTHLCLHVHMS